MKKLLFIIAITPVLFFAQSKKVLFEKYKSSILSKKINGEIEDKAIYEIIKGYECLKKNYNIKFNEQSDFLTEKEFLKKFKDTSYNNVMINSLNFLIYASNYDTRINLQKKFKKCVKLEDINY